MDRRGFFASLSALAGAAAMGPGAAFGSRAGPMIVSEQPFSVEGLIEEARVAATKTYKARPEVPKAWRDLTYDQYKSIWFRETNALWRNEPGRYEVDFFHPGLYFPRAVQINTVEDGVAYELGFDLGLFDKTDKFPLRDVDPKLGFSGFRLRTTFVEPDVYNECLVMQGASYFRAIGANQFYGLSARGLALKTADKRGEEFPEFTRFFIERPGADDPTIMLHAYLDSPSVTGVYSFDLIPGDETEIKVSATIFPRVDLDHVGLGPLTSMFLFDQTNRSQFDDFRPAVHDSDGLLVENGAGEILWRPLGNPKTLQVSSFVDNNPRGFGLMQRPRAFSDYADLEARYHKRPSLWIRPGEDWGRGAVTLVEIPADREIYDNIVAYWRPREDIPAGSRHDFSYTMVWGNEPKVGKPVAGVLNTSIGKRFRGGYIVAIDFEAHAVLPEDLSEMSIHIGSAKVDPSEGVLQRNPETGGPRLAFSFDPGAHKAVEFRAQLRHKMRAVTEVWLYRWTVRS